MGKSYVSIEQKLCPICGKEFDSGAILMDRKIRDKFDMKTTTGYKLCDECQKKKDEGYIAIVIVDPKKSDPNSDGTLKIKNAYRTGEIVHIKREVAKDMFNSDLSKFDFVFGDVELKNKLKGMMDNAKD